MRGYVLEMGDTPDAGILHILSKSDYGIFAIAPETKTVKSFGSAAHIRMPEDHSIVPVARIAEDNMVEIGAIMLSISLEALNDMRRTFDPTFKEGQ